MISKVGAFGVVSFSPSNCKVGEIFSICEDRVVFCWFRVSIWERRAMLFWVILEQNLSNSEFIRGGKVVNLVF